MEDVIAARGVSKAYGTVKAVKAVDLHVKRGEIYGFLGLNGAGKTTTIRMLLGMISPTSGAVFLNGRNVKGMRPQLWNDVGFLVEVPYAYPELTVLENLEIFRRLRGLKDSKAVDAVVEKLALGEYRHRKAGHLSLGNAQRLGLAKALLHRPDILVLDEPANGLDPAGMVEIRELLTSLAAEGVTVFLSSHILGEVAKFATRIGIIHRGSMVQEASFAELDGRRRREVRVITPKAPEAVRILARQGYAVTAASAQELSLTDLRATASPQEVTALLVNSGCPVAQIFIDEEDLESYFLRMIGEGGRE